MSLLSACPNREALAAFDVDSWSLLTAVQDFSGTSAVQDFEYQTQPTNSWLYSSLSQVDSSFSQADYDYSWLPELALGTFHTDISQSIPSPEVRAIATGQILILPDEDIRVIIDSSITYAHTPGDETRIDFGLSIQNMNSNEFLFEEHRQGGNLYLEPAAGTLIIAGEVILSAGTPYEFSYGIDSSNTADPLPTGTFDASGFTLFAIQPVPEPATALLAAALPALRRRRSSL